MLCLLHQAIIQNVQSSRKIKRQETQNQAPSEGKAPQGGKLNNPSLIESDQNEISRPKTKTKTTTNIASQTLLQVSSNSQSEHWSTFSKSGQNSYFNPIVEVEF